MCPSPTRLELRIDVFEKTNQKALVLADLKPPDLVAAILQEYRELEYLGDAAADYHLVKAADGSALTDDKLGSQLQGGERLVLVENDVPLPEGTRRPSQHIYLREQVSGKAFHIAWLPAIVGRVSENMPHNDQVAADLKSLSTGLRVSRRHALITEENGQYYIESMSSNPVSLIPAALLNQKRLLEVPVGETRQPLAPGDIVKLERSDISMKFVVREEPASVPPVEVTPAPAQNTPVAEG